MPRGLKLFQKIVDDFEEIFTKTIKFRQTDDS